MCGIDIEPDEGTLMANAVSMDNVVITDVTRYGIVNQFKRCNELNIINSVIENYVSPSAKIDKTHFIYDGSFECHVSECDIKNSHIEFKNQKQLVLFNNTKLSTTIIESTQDTYGNIMFEGDQCSMIGCTLKNLKNTNNVLGTITDYGVKIHGGRISDIENGENTYENCTVYVLGEFTLSNSNFKDCYIYLTSNGGTNGEVLDRWNVNGGTISTKSKLIINSCDINNANLDLGPGIKLITDSKLDGNFTNVAFADGSTCENSTIIAQNELSNNLFDYIKFTSNSKLILEQNDNTYVINNSYSVLNSDYTVEFGK